MVLIMSCDKEDILDYQRVTQPV